jgi:hypothetical protein
VRFSLVSAVTGISLASAVGCFGLVSDMTCFSLVSAEAWFSSVRTHVADELKQSCNRAATEQFSEC